MTKSPEPSKKNLLRKFWHSRMNSRGVQKHETGISGFDELLEGGLPQGRVTLVSAGPGCGKTVLLNEFIYRGASEFGEPGVFLTFEERPQDIILNLKNFDWPHIDDYIADEKIVFIDAAKSKNTEIQIGNVDWMEPILARIEYHVKRIGAKRLAVDNLNSIFLRYGSNKNLDQIRDLLCSFTDRIKSLGITTLVSTEQVNHQSSLSQYSVDEFVSEGLIELRTTTGLWQELRHMTIRKLRGCTYRSGSVQYDIDSMGLHIFPKIPIDTSIGETDFAKRRSFGIKVLDNCLSGGIPEGHTFLIAGNTGTGKTTLAMHFIQQGLEQGEPVIWVALEEPQQVVIKTALAHGWDLQKYVDNKQLIFVTSPLIDVYPDKLLYDIIDAVNQNSAKRIIVDSVSSLETAAMNKDSIRSFLLQLNGFSKTLGLNIVLNYLSDNTFGAEKGQLLGSLLTNAMRLSSIVDGILLLRYVERDNEVKKLLNILKLRGSPHDKQIFQYDIEHSGFKMGKSFKSMNS